MNDSAKIFRPRQKFKMFTRSRNRLGFAHYVRDAVIEIVSMHESIECPWEPTQMSHRTLNEQRLLSIQHSTAGYDVSKEEIWLPNSLI